MNNFIVPVAEIFGPTIQGEGPQAGVKTLFLRVAGCDFNCVWCDSKFAWGLKNAINYTSEELAEILVIKCKKTNTSHLVITGGNPCLYDFSNIISILKSNNIIIDVETQGSILPEWLLKCNQIVISPKAPSSKMRDVYEDINQWLDNNIAIPPTAIKIPIFNLVDFEFALRYNKLIQKYRNRHSIKFYLSVGNENTDEKGSISERILTNYKSLIELVMNSELDDIYILPQIHTLIWGNKQGV